MNISVNHRVIEQIEELKELVTDEVAAFCMSWKNGLDKLLSQDVQLLINRKRYGYEVKYHFAQEQINWLFLLELYYPNPLSVLEHKITYLKINKFATLPMYQGSGTMVFNHLMECTKCLSELSMIRLRSVRTAIAFWEKQGFVEGLREDDRCENLPQMLNSYRYMYEIRPCSCESCQANMKKQS